MPGIQITIRGDEQPELEAVLGERLYEFNSDTTGIDDGTLLNASVEDEAGRLVAGLSGHTWGGCGEITRLWVHESMRGTGVGTALMQAAEQEAIRRGCHQIVLSTFSFQAPRFYEKFGFRRVAAIPNYPQGHEYIVYIKDLPGASGT